MTKIIPIILSGGAGTRLWPISRRLHPKPFMKVAGKPLLAHALERAALIADEALIVTNQDHYYLTANLLKEMSKAPKVSYLLEPKGRNTGPAIALAVRHIQKNHGDDAVCLVLAADHLISDDAAFEKAVGQAASRRKRAILSSSAFAQPRRRPAMAIWKWRDGRWPQPLKVLLKSPTARQPKNISLQAAIIGTSGMFCFTAGVMAENMAAHAAMCGRRLKRLLPKAQEEAGVTRFEEAAFIAQPDISIDYAVMEKAKRSPWCRPVSAGRMSAAGMPWPVHMKPMTMAIARLVPTKCSLLMRETPMFKVPAIRKRSSRSSVLRI
jgi:mannose-1-phosphate guanylyltransferase